MNIYKGIVVSIDDEKFTGIIKCNVKGLYNSESFGNIDDDDLPNIYPLYSPNLNNFFTPKKDEEVYIILDRDNKQSAFWFAKSKLSDFLIGKLKNDYEGFKSVVVDEEEKLEVYFSRKEGLVLRQDDSDIIVFENEVKIRTKNRTLHVKDGHISLGQNDKSAEPVLLGDKTEKLFKNIINALTKVSSSLIGISGAMKAGSENPLPVFGQRGWSAIFPLVDTMKGTLDGDIAKMNRSIKLIKSTKTSLD